MAAAGQLDFPIDVTAGDFGGNSFGVADPAAVWAAKAGPFLREGVLTHREQEGRATCYEPFQPTAIAIIAHVFHFWRGAVYLANSASLSVLIKSIPSVC